MLKRVIIFFLFTVTFLSCDDNPMGSSMLTDNFDREEMLAFWADDIIIPAYTAYSNTLIQFQQTTQGFYGDPTIENFNALRADWLVAYGTWQEVAFFEIGKAEEIGLINFTNIYPTNVDLIKANITSQNYNLELPSNFAAQGFPALDYLFFGTGENVTDIIEELTQAETQEYVIALVQRLNDLSADILEDWNLNFRNAFIGNNGSSATSSTDKMVNDFLFYYERYLRAAKVGIPSGVFSGSIEPELIEARYSADFSKSLFTQGFDAIENFFLGISFDGLKEGPSLKQYLDDIHLSNNTEFDIAEEILDQWNAARIALDPVNENFIEQINQDNIKMRALYDELHKAVRYLKVDMLQALNIQVDYVDADGD